MIYNEEIRKHIEAITSGEMISVIYQSDLPVKASFKKQGISIRKITTCVCRTGVDYDNIQSVINSHVEGYVKQQRDWYSWDIKNKVRYHEGKGKHYLHVATVPNHSNSKSEYMICKDGELSLATKDSIVDFIIDSYWRNGGQAPAVKDISFENILQIKANGEVIA